MKPNESFIGQPVRSLQTMLRVLSKHDPRLPTVVPDGIYGPTTANAVTAFQRLNGMQANGIVDQQTWERIVDAHDNAVIIVGKAEAIEILLDPHEILKPGDSSPYILLMQAMLLALSSVYDMVPAPVVSGILDDETEAAIMAFQRLTALPETGLLDKVTWRYLSKHFTLHAHSIHKL